MFSIKKKIFLSFLFVYLIIGSFNSLNTGISFDENYEELNWKFNVKVVTDLVDAITSEKKFDKKVFDQEVKGYVGYGIGFQIISQPIQHFIKNFISNNAIDLYGSKLIAKHLVVFLFFFGSGIFFYLILKKIIDDENFYILGTIIYLTYPYLFGQSMFSPKDIPFMSIWLGCTWYSIKLLDNLIINKDINNINVTLISLITAYLISIRFAGILIFLQYFLLIVFYLNVFKKDFFAFLKYYYKKLLLFLFFTSIFILILKPIFLIDPLLIIETFKISASHFNNVGTKTFGTLMYSKDLPPTYLPIWLSVKLPIIVIIGLIFIPLSEKKMFSEKKNTIILSTLLLSFLSIIFILIFRNVHLYDEIRQILFLIPLIFIVSFSSLFFFKKEFFYILGLITCIFFIVESFKIRPYQYVWFNTPSRIIDLSKKFELEYQGISGREIAKFLRNEKNQDLCILANPIHSIKPFLYKTNFKCYDIWQKIDGDYRRPFLAAQNVRNLKKSIPFGCRSIHETSFKLFFQKEKIITGRVLECS